MGLGMRLSVACKLPSLPPPFPSFPYLLFPLPPSLSFPLLPSPTVNVVDPHAPGGVKHFDRLGVKRKFEEMQQVSIKELLYDNYMHGMQTIPYVHSSFYHRMRTPATGRWRRPSPSCTSSCSRPDSPRICRSDRPAPTTTGVLKLTSIPSARDGFSYPAS